MRKGNCVRDGIVDSGESTPAKDETVDAAAAIVEEPDDLARAVDA
jgi:hypothetical protein